MSRSYGGRWNLYKGYSQVGYVTPSAGRCRAYQGYARVGYVQGGPGGRAAVAALLLVG